MARRRGLRLALLAVVLVLSGLAGTAAAASSFAFARVDTGSRAARLSPSRAAGLAPVAPRPSDVLGRTNRTERELAGRRYLLVALLFGALLAVGRRRAMPIGAAAPPSGVPGVVRLRAPPFASVPTC
jgi:hypothetical protein